VKTPAARLRRWNWRKLEAMVTEGRRRSRLGRSKAGGKRHPHWPLPPSDALAERLWFRVFLFWRGFDLIRKVSLEQKQARNRSRMVKTGSAGKIGDWLCLAARRRVAFWQWQKGAGTRRCAGPLAGGEKTSAGVATATCLSIRDGAAQGVPETELGNAERVLVPGNVFSVSRWPRKCHPTISWSGRLCGRNWHESG